MRIVQEISSKYPEKCRMTAKGLFGNVKGEVKYSTGYDIEGLGKRPGYFVITDGKMRGAATDFLIACEMLLQELKVIKTVCV